MKRIIHALALVLLIVSAERSIAQCTPNTNQNIFLIPDTVQNFDTAWVNHLYDQILYIAVPTDTIIMGFPVTIDSIVIQGVTSLPGPIGFSVNPVNGLLVGGAKGCMEFKGTPLIADTGLYHLVIQTKVTLYNMLIGDTTVSINWKGYRILVLDSASLGVRSADAASLFSVRQNTPNPFQGNTEIAYTSQGNEDITLRVFDLLGNQIHEQAMVSSRGMNYIHFSSASYEPGIYVYSLTNGSITQTRRMAITGH